MSAIDWIRKITGFGKTRTEGIQKTQAETEANIAATKEEVMPAEPEHLERVHGKLLDTNAPLVNPTGTEGIPTIVPPPPGGTPEGQTAGTYKSPESRPYTPVATFEQTERGMAKAPETQTPPPVEGTPPKV